MRRKPKSADAAKKSRSVSQITRAAQRLADAEATLQHLVGREVDVVLDRHGHPLLLRSTQEALLESEARKTAILESALDAVITIDRQGQIVELNPAAEKMFGYGRGDLWGRSLEILIPPSMREAHRRGLARYLATRERRFLGKRVELSAVRSDGSEFPIELSVNPVMTNGPPLFTGYIRDISERQQAETSRSQLAALVESSEDAIIGKTLDGIILSWNKAAEKLYGYSADEVRGRSIDILAPPERRSEVREILERLKRGDHMDQLETVRVRKNGEHVQVSLTISPIRNTTGKIIAASVIARDITERKRSEAAVLARNEELQRLHEIGRMLLDAFDLQSALDRTLEKSLQLISFDMGIIRLLDADTEILEPASVAGFRDTGNVKPKSARRDDPTLGPFLRGVLNKEGAFVAENISEMRGPSRLQE